MKRGSIVSFETKETSNPPNYQIHKGILFQGEDIYQTHLLALLQYRKVSFQQEAKQIMLRNATLKQLSKSQVFSCPHQSSLSSFIFFFFFFFFSVFCKQTNVAMNKA